MKISLNTLAFFSGLTLASAANAALITFDDLGLSPNQYLQTALSPISIGNGYTMSRSSVVSGTNGIIINAIGSGNSYNAGQNSTFSYVTAHNPGQSLLHTLGRSDAASFSLQSLDFHGWNNNFAPSLIVTGNFLLGGSITQTFNITNTFTSPYQSALFSTAWTGLGSISFSSPQNVVGVFQIDNILVSTVPVPAAAWLLGSGLLGLIGVARKRKAV